MKTGGTWIPVNVRLVVLLGPHTGLKSVLDSCKNENDNIQNDNVSLGADYFRLPCMFLSLA